MVSNSSYLREYRAYLSTRILQILQYAPAVRSVHAYCNVPRRVLLQRENEYLPV